MEGEILIEEGYCNHLHTREFLTCRRTFGSHFEISVFETALCGWF